MSESKHTPGPWIVGGDVVCDTSYLNRHVATTISGGVPANEELANLDLIAAAPDMLDACNVALGHLTGGMDGDWRDVDLRELLRTVITKATGA